MKKEYVFSIISILFTFITTLVWSQKESCNLVISEKILHTCGKVNGLIDLSINGGSVPYTIKWSHGEQTSKIVGLSSGSYHVNIYDTHGCSISKNYFIKKNIPFTAEIKKNKQGNEYDVEVVIIGNSSSYQYFWVGPNILQKSFNGTSKRKGLKKGHYHITITNTEGCMINVQTLLE